MTNIVSEKNAARDGNGKYIDTKQMASLGMVDKEPIYIVDDKEVSEKDLISISANDIKGLNVYKSSDGKRVFEFDTKNNVSTYVTVRGLVKDTAGNTLPKAKINVKGGAVKGTVTDEEGYFVLRVPKNGILQVSYKGMATSTLNASSQLMVTMKKEESR
ncbi:carboxypeptidase regulatory-like domain-containing protein [Bacteroides faecalis]|uniref:TonB-dependent receptor plug domain-containing protein n=1 Tax=Bacteroides faecalis TaxID=2447885 RepID=A0A401LRV4_9BACE|nr:carboxypeptidase regulatory-like domain-containing protein [Bacteroides faecalis]GCB34157.1 hypothetical protein KGMB02408_11020 [Bacteroides faecalis]